VLKHRLARPSTQTLSVLLSSQPGPGQLQAPAVQLARVLESSCGSRTVLVALLCWWFTAVLLAHLVPVITITSTCTRYLLAVLSVNRAVFVLG